MTDYTDVTELASTPISKEQLFRLYNRYHWSSQYCIDKEVLEVACGSAAGVGYLARFAKSVRAGDYSEKILEKARDYYQSRFEFDQFDAQNIPYNDNSFDVIIIHEALYYIEDATRFIAECQRLLRPNGQIIITSSNKDLFDFNPSPHSTVYHGVIELRKLLENYGFTGDFYGSQPTQDMTLIQKYTRFCKFLAVKLGLIPKTMRGKRFLKRIIFGSPVMMPSEVMPNMTEQEIPLGIPNNKPCLDFKIIYCVATKNN